MGRQLSTRWARWRIAAGILPLAFSWAAAAQSFPPRELTPQPSSADDFQVEEEISEPELFDGPGFGVVHPEVRDGALGLAVTPWAETVYLRGRGPLLGAPNGPPWWDPSTHPPGALIFVY